MKTIDIVLPAMGEGIVDATITKWLVSVGETVAEDQSLVEVATDKVDSEIPSPISGKVKELLFNEGDVPKVGQTIALLEVEGQVNVAQSLPEEKKDLPKSAEKNMISKESKTQTVNKKQATIDYKLPNLSPLVRTIVKQEGISPDELHQVKGTGLNERITRDDILAYVDKRSRFIDKPNPIVTPKETADSSPLVEVVHMDRMRKLIAEHMVLSKQTSAHVTSFIEADVTNLVAWRNANKDAFEKREGQKLTLTPLFIEVTVKALKQFPMINSSVDGDKILVKKAINIGLATALPNGNLIVPVIKGADKLNLAGLSAGVNDLAKRARENKLQPNEIQGGTFTITNLGIFETLTGTPIINQPQVAILAIGAINKRVVVIESNTGDTIGIRQIAMLSISYDHRVVDGALAGMFLKAVRDNLQGFSHP